MTQTYLPAGLWRRLAAMFYDLLLLFAWVFIPWLLLFMVLERSFEALNNASDAQSYFISSAARWLAGLYRATDREGLATEVDASLRD